MKWQVLCIVSLLLFGMATLWATRARSGLLLARPLNVSAQAPVEILAARTLNGSSLDDDSRGDDEPFQTRNHSHLLTGDNYAPQIGKNATNVSLRELLPQQVPMFPKASLWRSDKGHCSARSPPVAGVGTVFDQFQYLVQNPSCEGTCKVGIFLEAEAKHWIPPRGSRTDDVELQEWVNTVVGPDAFRLIVSGPERTFASARLTVSDKRFAYNFTTEVFSEGNYTVDLKWSYSDYLHFNENLGVLSSYVDRSTSLGWFTCASPRRLGPEAAPLCVDGGGLGRYVRLNGGLNASAGASSYYPYRGVEWDFRLVGCRLRQFATQPERLDECLAHRLPSGNNLRVLFIGDSQIRTLYQHWYSIITRNGRVNLVWKFNHWNLTHPTHTAIFSWDPYLDLFAVNGTDLISQYDVVVLGMGQWPASHGHWTVRQFFKQTSRVAAQIARSNRNGKLIVWAGAPAWPRLNFVGRGWKRRQKFRVHMATNYRIGAFASMGAKLLATVGVKQIDFFQLSFPQMELGTKALGGDDQHYHRSVVLFSALNIFANMICNLNGTAFQR